MVLAARADGSVIDLPMAKPSLVESNSALIEAADVLSFFERYQYVPLIRHDLLVELLMLGVTGVISSASSSSFESPVSGLGRITELAFGPTHAIDQSTTLIV